MSEQTEFNTAVVKFIKDNIKKIETSDNFKKISSGFYHLHNGIWGCCAIAIVLARDVGDSYIKIICSK